MFLLDVGTPGASGGDKVRMLMGGPESTTLDHKLCALAIEVRNLKPGAVTMYHHLVNILLIVYANCLSSRDKMKTWKLLYGDVMKIDTIQNGL